MAENAKPKFKPGDKVMQINHLDKWESPECTVVEQIGRTVVHRHDSQVDSGTNKSDEDDFRLTVSEDEITAEIRKLKETYGE